MNTDLDPPRRLSVAKALLQFLLPMLVLASGAWYAQRLLVTAPKAEARQRETRSAQLVEIFTTEPGNHRVTIPAMGTVIPAREVALHPRVGGMVKETAPAFQPGGHFRAGETLLWIDDADLALAVKQAEAAVEIARGEFDLERGQQATAREELALIREKLQGEDLRWVLREPQLQSATARLKNAENALELARLALARASVVVPFNAVVLERHTETGSQVGPSAAVATLAGTDAFWVELSIPGDDLRWIDIPDQPVQTPEETRQTGANVKITSAPGWLDGQRRDGHLIGLAAALEPETRMARVLAAVPDPLSLTAATHPAGPDTSTPREPVLLLGSFVSAEIAGPELRSSYRISRAHLRAGDHVWLMDENGKLAIRKVEVAHRGNDHVLVTGGLNPGDRIVTSNLRTAVEGMSLRVSGAAAETPSPTKDKP